MALSEGVPGFLSFTSDLSTSSITPSLPTTSSILSAHQAAIRENVPSSLAAVAGRLLIAAATFLPSLLLGLVKFITLSIVTWLYHMFSRSWTFTMSFTTLLLVVLVLIFSIIWLLRYRLLNMYARLPQESQRKEPQIDLYPDTQDGDSKPGLGNYLDEFLEAIKVFGYLERPVFHELTRTMQTKKLIAGETLLLEEEKGYCLVVDGLVQIFVKSMRDVPGSQDGHMELPDHDEDSYQEGNQGYQLLTEVKNGASMSSLFSILSLFTEDIKLRLDDNGRDLSSTSAGLVTRPIPSSAPMTPAGPASPRETMDPAHSTVLLSRSHLPHVPPLTLDHTNGEGDRVRGPSSSRRAPKANVTKSAHPDIVARAVVDTTIAIIPASAFRRLTTVYPRATAHIVQVIMTRLQRVTLATAHQYLGMTTEVLQAEKSMNRYTSYELPNHLRGAALDRLKDKFAKETDRVPADQGFEGIALHHPASKRRRSSSVLRKKAPLSALLAATSLASTPSQLSLSAPPESHHVSPGDLLSNIQISRFGDRLGSSTVHSNPRLKHSDSLTASGSMLQSPLFDSKRTPIRPISQHGVLHRQESLDEDTVFRDSILECMIRALGLDTSVKDVTSRYPGAASVEQSPRLVSYDSKRQTAVFSNAFGLIDPYDASTDGDTASVGSFAGSTPGRSLSDDLIDDLEVVYFPQHSILVEQGERNPGIYYVIDGFLDVSVPVEEKENRAQSTALPRTRSSRDNFPLVNGSLPKSPGRPSSVPGNPRDHRRTHNQRSLFLIKPGGIAGYTGTVSSHRSFTNVTAKTDVYVGFLPRPSIERVAEKYPVLLLTMAKRLTSLLPKLILHIDFALEWVQVNAGQVIYHQGDESDAIYIVLNGRLRTVLKDDMGRMRLSGEFGQGDSIGELEVLTESQRPATLHAIRDSELVKLPKTLFNSLAQENPNITIQISKLIAERMRALVESPITGYQAKASRGTLKQGANSSQNLRTVAILPITAAVPVVEFGARLLTALTQIGVAGGVTSLNQAVILNHLGRHAFSRMGKLKLAQYLADLEEKFGLLLYIADTPVNAPWTQTCITQADCILLVGLAESSPAVGEYERFLLGMKTTARKELVLLHTERFSPPGLTRKWLRSRVWINGTHHHIHMADRPASHVLPNGPTKRVGSAIKQKVQVLQAGIQKYTSRRVRQTPLYSAQTPFKGDLHRLARHLCGRSIGLVLGGGGARGISQIGVIRALEEAGVPIDIVGGTSIGAFIGALYARDADVVPMYGRAKKFAGRMSSKWRFLLDLTYPALSYTTGHEFNRGIYKIFDNSEIEDFWLSFYCNTTNISKSRAEIHTSGYAWRYVRASMSLAGLIPPICDDGSMLLDGGYMDNLTVSHMKRLGADVVFAVDVGALDEQVAQEFGDSLSGFWTLLHRFNIFSSRPNPPTLAEVQARLAYVSSYDALERAKATPGCLYMRPPIDAYGTLEFAKFDEIYRLGYSYGQQFLADLRDRGELKGVVSAWDESEESKGLRRTMAPRRASI